MAGFLTRAMGGPLEPAVAADLAAATNATRIPDGEAPFAAVEDTLGGFRTLAQVALPGATRAPTARHATDASEHDRRPEPRAMTGSGSGTDPVWRAIATKRVVRRFADRPLEPAHLERILDAGRHSGSSKNMQRWTFIVCRDRDHLRELSVVGPWAGHLAGAAVAVALLTPDPRRPRPAR